MRLLELAGAGGLAGLGLWLTALTLAGRLNRPRGVPAADGARAAGWAAPSERRGHGRTEIAGLAGWRQVRGAGATPIVAAAFCGLVVGWLVGVPVLAVAAGGLVFLVREARGLRAVPRVNELGEAIATWCETIRQDLDAGQQLLAAVAASCQLPPPPLADPLAGLARRLGEREPLPVALAAFHRDVEHPAVGQVVVALNLAYRHGAGDLARLMASQVETTRHRVAVLRDLHAGRARHRRAMSLLLGLFTLVTVVLLGAWPAVLAPYRTGEGQLVLAGLLLAVAGAVRALLRRSRPPAVPDFFRETP
ncbi:hypothetical protein I6A60_24710 [Frankia sp. AgB1.9]|uniref:type II secretion system F family protein n=1 Tax=unclassified Frankia TaxID=2632575 RepID=UPI0019336B03|nr:MULTISPECIES: hypothetical protein [unclassified Frankia]MBL7487440.1 hypothetical protein [Frankia sp. AgW1.1]MBL7551042.1 hypothetical protein [Frankia sp. AgB1.9]MBL7618823.1 hypothetical protein [Frankia sp. AgB1.8]